MWATVCGDSGVERGLSILYYFVKVHEIDNSNTVIGTPKLEPYYLQMNLNSIYSQDPQLSCYEQFLFLFFAHTSEEENVSAWRLQFLYYF